MSQTTENVGCSVRYEPETKTYCTSFGSDSDSPSTAIVTAIASLTDNHPHNLPPLYDTINPEALDAMFLPSRGGGPSPDARLTFTYNDYTITVKATGLISIDPHEEIE